jgi:hypothetical protein
MLETETTTSPADVVVTGAPEGVVVAAWLFKTAVWLRGAVVFTPENSQMTAVPRVPLGLGVIVSVVAPELLFLAYQMSIIVFGPESTALALPAAE